MLHTPGAQQLQGLAGLYLGHGLSGLWGAWAVKRVDWLVGEEELRPHCDLAGDQQSSTLRQPPLTLAAWEPSAGLNTMHH